MAISATFTADFTKFNQALADAKSGLKSFEQPVKGVQQSLERMAKSFAGADIKRQAEIAAAAVEKIGGVTKLTEAEQRKLNSTVSEAIAKYRALGQSAPDALVKLEKETRQADNTTKGLGSTLGGLKGLFAGAFAGIAIGSVVKDVIALGGELSDLSARTGIGVKALQEFQFAGKQVGVSLDSISTAVGQMQKKVAGGDDSAEAALTKLGISVKNFRELRPEEQFQLVADKISAIEDPAARAKLAMDIMGKGALEVMPLLVGGLGDLRAEAERLGIVLDEQTVANLDNLGDSLDTVKLAGQAALANAIVPLTPALTEAAGAASVLASQLGSSLGTVLRDAQLTFQTFLSQINLWIANVGEAAVSVLKFQNALNPLANITGSVDKQIALLNETITQSKYVAKDLADNVLTQLIKAQTAHETVVKRTVPTILDVAKAHKAHADAVKQAIPQTETFTHLMYALSQAVPNTSAVLETAAERVRIFTQDVIPSRRAIDDFMVGAQAVPAALAPIPRSVETVGGSISGLAKTFATDLSTMGRAIDGAFAQMLLGAKGFHDGFLDIWESIKSGIARILTDILADFTSRFLKGLIAALTGAKGGFSGAFSGLFGGGGGLLGGLFGGGGGAAAGGIGAAVPVSSLFGAGTGAAGAGAGGAAAGGGGLFGLGALGTATVVGGAALGAFGLYKWLSSGRRKNMAANDSRDAFTSQFGGTGTGAGSGFANLAAKLTEATGEAGGGRLFKEFLDANKPEEVAKAIEHINAELAKYAQTSATAAAKEEQHAAAIAKTKQELEEKTAAIKTQMQSLDDELAKLNASEAPEEHMGTVEKRTRERIAREKADLQRQLDAAQEAAAKAIDEINKAGATSIDTLKTQGQSVIDGLKGGFVDFGSFATDTISDVRARLIAMGKNLPPITVRVNYPEPPDDFPVSSGSTSIPGHAAGGVFSTPHLARIAEGGHAEMVGSVGFMSEALVGALARTGGIASGASSSPTVVVLNVDGRELARAIATPLPGQVRRLGVRVRT